jgi:tetrahydromethanopterin S-methyltransferase subunit A
MSGTQQDPISEAVGRIREATSASKCWKCGCFHDTLNSIEGVSIDDLPLKETVTKARGHLQDRQYECLGCAVCYPALAINALSESGRKEFQELEVCATEIPKEREGWPPLPGDYNIVRYHSPVAVCTLNDSDLMKNVMDASISGISIVGTLQTENLGIERLVQNIITNPHIRFLILAGQDSRQKVGHLPGQSLLSLARNGLDEKGRIIGAKGKRPLIRNIPRESVDHFRQQIDVVDIIGNTSLKKIQEEVKSCAAQNPGSAEVMKEFPTVEPHRGQLPSRMIPDPEGFFVIYVDQIRELLVLEYYRKNGTLSSIVEGKTAEELYTVAIEKKMLTRLDHAAYLGKELTRAESSLLSGKKYIQDGVTEEKHDCNCESSCREEEK